MPARSYGMHRKATRKERLRWDVYFSAPVPPAERHRMTEGLQHVSASWALDRILTLVWDRRGAVTTALFRDQVASRLDAWDAAVPLVAAHLCCDGPWRESRARARESAGLPAYPFPFLGHAQRPARHEWRLTLLVERMPEPESPGMGWFRKVGFVPLRAGPWLRFRHRTGIDPTPAMFASIVADLDDALEQLHEHAGISLAIFGSATPATQGDDWHTWTVRETASTSSVPPDDRAFEPLFAGAPALDAATLAALMEEARASYDHAGDQGDPESALEGLLDARDRLPRAHAEERRRIDAWIAELSAVIGESADR